ncbi:bacteriocin immunity protein [Pseudomonas sp. CC120222-01a]|uniref:bacteriocin immunity protein n=1 Tax=Pseudomonas sp. CC120222-01a TaxID=1378075 RepID=UPI000DA235FE|nr:bacteriocin immunity protein [Pseudomonas sp. CC120222-01a]
MNTPISKITEEEFLSFVRKIYAVDYPTDEAHRGAVQEFKRISEHPAGSDLLFYPEEGKDSPEQIVAEVKAWRAANGKPGFAKP